MNLLNDNELIDRCDYIFSLFEIFLQVESKYRDYELFKKIITTCYPFDLNYAKNQLKEMKKLKVFYSRLIIDGSSLQFFEIENLKEDQYILLDSKKGQHFEVKAKEINWYLGEDLISYFDSYDFMICFTYETLLNKNLLKVEPIYEKFNELFKTIIKSDAIKESLSKYSEDSEFEYPFNNEDVINECEESIYYVPFPVSGIYGYTDKNSFKTYINCNFKANSIQSTFTEYANILKTKIHEYKSI